LFELNKKQQDGCGLHPGAKHKFFNCFDTVHICDENGWMDALVEAKMRNNQRVTCTNAAKEAMKKPKEKIAAKKATIDSQNEETPPPLPEDESESKGSQMTDSTDGE